MADQITITEVVEQVIVAEENLTLSLAEERVEVVDVGIQGPPGPQGTSGDAHFFQAFTSVSTVTVTHNLGKRPAVSVIDSAGDEVEGAVDHIDSNTLTVSFSAPFSGNVVLN